MKRVILALDGIADEPLEALDGKTPLEIAKKPHMNALACEGTVGRLRLTGGKSGPAEEWVALNLLGHPSPERCARGPLCAAAIGLRLPEDNWQLACRLVTVLDGKLVDARAGGIGERESTALFEALNRVFKGRDIRFYSGDPRCHMMSVRADEDFAKLGELDLADPDTALGGDQFGAWSRAASGAQLKALLLEAAEVLETHEINKVRVDLNENPANALWVWGAGRPMQPAPFAGAGGAVVLSTSDGWKGAARAAGVEWAPAFTGPKPEPSELADLAGRFKGWLKTHDWVYLHLSEMDRCALAGDYKKKIRWIEAVDQHLLAPLRERLAAEDRLAVVSGFVSASGRKERTSAEAPLLIWGAGAEGPGPAEFSEEAAASAKAIAGGDFLKKIN